MPYQKIDDDSLEGTRSINVFKKFSHDIMSWLNAATEMINTLDFVAIGGF